MPAKKTTSRTAKVRTVRKTRAISEKRIQYRDVVEHRSKAPKKSPEQLKLLINPEDTPSNPLTYKRLMDWLADTGWVEGFIRKTISPMDAHLIEDFTQTIWLQILQVKPERMMEIWYHGKGKFVNYLKGLMGIQLKSYSGACYKDNKHFHKTHICLSDEQWSAFEDGDIHTTFINSYPAKYNCPSGNRKKMVIVEHEELPISTEYELLTDEQIHSELMYEKSKEQ